MAITCPRCGAGFDVTLFQFGRGVRCDCGAWVELSRGHVAVARPQPKEEVPMAEQEQEIGKVTHYFGKFGVAAIEITQGSLAVGETIHIKGHTTDFTQKVESMQIEHQQVARAEAGQSVGIKVVEHARPHNLVYKVAG
jgi:putative protease